MANNPPGKIQMFITKSRHEREMEALGKELNDAAELVKGVEPHRRLWLSDRVAIVIAQRDEFEAKFKKAITDLAAVTRDYGTRGDLLAEARREANELRPDAQKWRDRAAREAKRGEAKRAAAKGADK